MKQTLCIIRTLHFDAMRDFYRDSLRLRHLDPVEDDFISFRDFQAEIQIQAVDSAGDVGITGFLRLIGSKVLGISEMFRERGVAVQLRDNSTKAFIIDPDGNIILLVAASDESA